MRPLSPLLCCRSKAINITYSESVSVALFIWHAKRMRSILLSSVACLAVPYFSPYFTYGTTFWEKKLLNIKCVVILYTTFAFNISYSYSSATLTEVFPCFFLSCKANAGVKLAKMGQGPHSSKLVVICVVLLLFVLFYVLFVCKCVLSY